MTKDNEQNHKIAENQIYDNNRRLEADNMDLQRDKDILIEAIGIIVKSQKFRPATLNELFSG